MKVLEEGTWSDGPVMAEYFGNIVASRHGEDAADDRAAIWATKLSQLASNDILLHHLIYTAIRRVFVGRADINLGYATGRVAAAVFLPMDELFTHIPDVNNRFQELAFSASALEAASLIHPEYTVGHVRLGNETRSGIAVASTGEGLWLMNFAHGHPRKYPLWLLHPEADFGTILDLPTVENPEAFHLDSRSPADPAGAQSDDDAEASGPT